MELCSKYLKTELERHRPAIGSCLGAFSSTFPVAYLEPHLNKANHFSIHHRMADHSLEAQGKFIRLIIQIMFISNRLYNQILIRNIKFNIFLSALQYAHQNLLNLIKYFVLFISQYMPTKFNYIFVKLLFVSAFLDVMARMDASMPTLETILAQVEQFVDSEKTHADAPHIIAVILPMLCSYLPFWWSQGPDNVGPTAGG